MSKKSFALKSLIVVLLLGAVAVGVVRVFFIRMVRVPTSNMANTILRGDHLVINKLLGKIHRGDVVTYLNPEKREYYMGRVIGLPGESIQVSGRLVYINNRVLDEQRVMVQPQRNGYDQLTELSTEGTGPYTVYYTKRAVDDFGDSGDFGVDAPFAIPADSYFILGDNRDNSNDSRYRGAIPGKLIWGKATIIYYSENVPTQDGVRTERIFKRVH